MISCQWYHSWSVARRTNLILGYLTHPKKEQTQRKSKGHFSLFPFHCISSLLNQVFVVVQQDNHLTLTFIWKGKTLSWARKRRRRRMKEIESKKITAKLSNLRSREKKRKRERETWLTSRLLFLFSRNKTEKWSLSPKVFFCSRFIMLFNCGGRISLSKKQVRENRRGSLQRTTVDLVSFTLLLLKDLMMTMLEWIHDYPASSLHMPFCY